MIEKNELESKAKAALEAANATGGPTIVPKPKDLPQPQRHVKVNVVLDDVVKRARAPESKLAKKKKKGNSFKGATCSF